MAATGPVVVVDGSVDDRSTLSAPDFAARWAALAVLAVALLMAICWPGVVGRRVVGHPAQMPPPGPPAVGACRAVISEVSDLTRMTGVPRVNCNQPHSAEVVSIGALDTDVPYPRSPDDAALEAPKAACNNDIQEFLGLLPGGAVNPYSVQAAIPLYRVQIVVPTEYQWSYGQRWFACQVTPAATEVPIAYSGTVQDVVRGTVRGTVPLAFAHCAQEVGGTPVPCTQVHAAEKISASFPVSRGNLDCLAINSILMATPDPNYNWSLHSVEAQDAQGVACWVTSGADRGFTGTLIGFGERTITFISHR